MLWQGVYQLRQISGLDDDGKLSLQVPPGFALRRRDSVGQLRRQAGALLLPRSFSMHRC